MRAVFERLALVLVMLFVCGQAHAQTATEQFQAVEFGQSSKPIIIAPDGRLQIRSSGSIEIGIEISGTVPQAMVLLSLESPNKKRFRIVIADFGKALAIDNDGDIKALRHDFTDGPFSQIGLSTVGSNTQIFVNGASIGEIDAGYGPSDDSLPLNIGGPADGSLPFVGKIHYVRMWNRPLTGDDYRATFSYYGNPVALPSLAPSVVLYSQFTNKRVAAYFTQPPTYADLLVPYESFEGAREGRMFIDRIPDGMRFYGMLVSGVGSIQALRVLVKDAQGNIIGLPVRGAIGPNDAPDPALFVLEDGETLAEVHGKTSLRDYEGSGTPGGRQVVRRAPTLTALTLATSKGRRSPTLGDSRPFNTPGDATAFAWKFTDSFRLDAIYGYETATGVVGIGIDTTVDIRVKDATGLWVRETLPDHAEKVPDAQVIKAGGRLPHGNYLKRDVVKLSQTHRGRALSVYLSDQNYAMRLGLDGTYQGANARLAFEDKDTFVLNGERYRRVKPYPAHANDAGTLGGQFNLNNQVPFYKYSYYGYDISAMNPMNVQVADGQKRPVLKVPDENGTDYYVDKAKNVPAGMLYAADAREKSIEKGIIIKSAQENAEINSTTLGINIGVPKLVAFGVNSTVSKTSQQNSASEKLLTLIEDIGTTRALVLDFARVELDPYFRQRIVNLTAQRRAGQSVDYVNDVIRPFGTHVPNAVTLGWGAREFISYSKRSVGALQKQGTSVAANATAVVKGVTTKGTYQNQSEHDEAFNRELENQVKTKDSVGDKADPVPILMDLRPLDELLSPIFFDDEITFTQIRSELQQAIRTYLTSNAPTFDPLEDNWNFYSYEVKLTKIVFPREVRNYGLRMPAIYGELGFDLAFKDKTPQVIYSIPENEAVDVAYRDPPIEFAKLADPEPVTVPIERPPTYYALTAKQLCSGFSASISVGGTLHLRAVSTPTVENTSMAFVYPIGLNTNELEVRHTFSFQKGKTSRAGADEQMDVVLHASARRLPDPDGLAAYPQCPKR